MVHGLMVNDSVISNISMGNEGNMCRRYNSCQNISKWVGHNLSENFESDIAKSNGSKLVKPKCFLNFGDKSHKGMIHAFKEVPMFKEKSNILNDNSVNYWPICLLEKKGLKPSGLGLL